MNYSSLTIDGRFYKKPELVDWAKTGLQKNESSDWQKSIFNFLLSWLNEDESIEVKTSGSTGAPKTIRIKKQWMVNSAINTGSFLGLRPGDSSLLCLPAEYIAGKMMLARAMVLELNLSMVEPSSNPLKNNHQNFHFAAMVPLQVFTILQEKSGSEKISSIQNLIIGGAPVSSSIKNKIKKFSNRIFSTYGMTETITHIALEPLNGEKADGWLRTLPGIKVNTDEKSRLVIEAPELSDGLLLTNDLALVKDQNHFKILGRYDNLIISGGIKLSPEIIEKKIEKLFPQRIILSSLPDEGLGEKLVLVIEGESVVGKSDEKILDLIKAYLGPYETPKQILYLKSFPETGHHKINRREISKIIRSLNT